MKTLKELKQNLKHDVKSYPLIKIALLGDTATQLLKIALEGMAIERGYKLDIYEADYNQVERQLMDKSSDLYEYNPEFVIVFQSTHKLLGRYSGLPHEEKINIAYDRLEFIEAICSNISAKIIYFNYPEIDDVVFGSYGNKHEASFIHQNRKLNYQLMLMAQRISDLYICDIASIQNQIGRNTMFDASIYPNTEMVLSIDSLPYIAARTIDIIAAHKGSIRKCLVLDLDNTLWGGVIGDDGIEGIQIGHGLGIGIVYSEFQQWLKKMKDRGIILAINSKNTESVAKEPFEKHPEMILRLSDIAVFVANWENKAQNMIHIQSILNIGYDSMVFIDDNPFERNMVRENVPDVHVPEMPEDPADWLEYLYAMNLFETISYSSVDSDRTKQYQSEAKRVTSQKSFTNEDDYLKNLSMGSLVEGFTPYTAPRIAQLSQRSNQFNLRTIRYDEADIHKITNDPDYHCFSFTLEDKYGDNGLICVVIMKAQDGETLFIDTWFMSCRVLKRGMENFVINTLVNFATENGYKKIVGEYIPTEKNEIVSGHYSRLGFDSMDGSTTRYVLETGTYKTKKCHIKRKEDTTS
jgi:FkbH-like protein